MTTTTPSTSPPRTQLKQPPPPPLTAPGGPRDPTKSVTATRQGSDLHINIPPPLTSVPPSGTRLTYASGAFPTPTVGTQGRTNPAANTAIHAPTAPQQIIVQGVGAPGRQPARPPQPPRVGGILQVGHDQWDVFTGGSNVGGPHTCRFTTQRRPSKFESVSSFETLLDKGMEQKLAAPEAKGSDVTLTIWFTNMSTSLIRLGLDTIFRIPTVAREIYIAEEWGHFRAPILQRWAERLQNGVGGGPVCPYDLKNLDYSGRFLLASLTKTYKYTILEELGPSPNGLEVFIYIVKTRLIKALSRQRDLITKLSTFKLSDQEGENVRKFNVKLRDCCREIEQTGPPPRDLAFMVACTYVTSQVPFFANKMLDIQLQLEDTPNHMTWQQVLENALNNYLAMDTFWTPAGNSLGSQQALKAEINSLRQSLNSLKLNTGKGKKNEENRENYKKPKFEKICFDCGAKNQIKGHEGCKHKEKSCSFPKNSRRNPRTILCHPMNLPPIPTQLPLPPKIGLPMMRRPKMENGTFCVGSALTSSRRTMEDGTRRKLQTLIKLQITRPRKLNLVIKI